MVAETKTLGKSNTPWKRLYERACEAANAAVQTYVRSSAHMVLSLRSDLESRRSPALYERGFPAAGETWKVHTTANIFGDPLQLSRDDGRFYPPSAAGLPGAGGDFAAEERAKALLQVESYPDCAPVVSTAQRIATRVPFGAIPDYMARPVAAQLDLIASEPIVPSEQLNRLEAARSGLESLNLYRTDVHLSKRFHDVLARADETESPGIGRDSGLYSKYPLTAFQRVDDPIGSRVQADSWRGGVLPSSGTDLRYAPVGGLDPGNVTHIAERWFKQKKADSPGQLPTGKAETAPGGVQEKIPDFFPMLHHLSRQPMHVDLSKRPAAAKKPGGQAVVVKGEMLRVEEEPTGPPVITVVKQKGMKAIVQQLEFEAPRPPIRLPRKKKTTKELGIQTEAPHVPPPSAAPAAKVSRKSVPAKIIPPAPRRQRTPSESSSTYTGEGSTEDISGSREETEISEPLTSVNDSQAGTLQASQEERKNSSEQTSPSVSEDSLSGGTTTLSPAAWQLLFRFEMLDFLQQMVPTAFGIPNPVGPPKLQTQDGEHAQHEPYSLHSLGVPPDMFAAAYMQFFDLEHLSGRQPAETLIPDPQQVPDVGRPEVMEKPQQSGVPPGLYEEARRLFPPGFEQVHWESILWQTTPVPPGFPVVQVGVQDVSKPWQAVCEETQLAEQWKLYHQWQQLWQQQWNAYAEAVRREKCEHVEEERTLTAADGVQENVEGRQAMAQKLRKEFHSFARAQQSIEQAFGGKPYRGRAAIGNCRGGRGSWRLFDRTVRTAAERTRQRRLRMCPEVDDFFDTVPPPTLRALAGDARRVRGGFRRRTIRRETSYSRFLRSTQAEESRRKYGKEKMSARTSEDYGAAESSDADVQGSSEERGRDRHSEQVESDEDKKVEREVSESEDDNSTIESEETADWFDRERLRLHREHRIDTIAKALADYLDEHKDPRGGRVRHVAVPPPVSFGAGADEHDAEAIQREAIRKKRPLELRNHLHVSEKEKQLPRRSVDPAAGKLTSEITASRHERLRGATREQQLFVGLLNVVGSQGRRDPGCTNTAETGDCRLLRHFSSKHLQERQSAPNSVEDSKAAKLKPSCIQGSLDANIRHVSSAFPKGRESKESTTWKQCCNGSGSEVSACRLKVTAEADSHAFATLRGRTLLDASTAAPQKERTQVEDPAHRVSPCGPLSFPDTYEIVTNDDAIAAGEHTIPNPTAEGKSSTSVERAEPNLYQEPYNSKMRNTSVAGPLMGCHEFEKSSAATGNDSAITSPAGDGGFGTASSSAMGMHFDEQRPDGWPWITPLDSDTISNHAAMIIEPRISSCHSSVHSLQVRERGLTHPQLEKASAVACRQDTFSWVKRSADCRARKEMRSPSTPIRPESFPWDEVVIPACRGRCPAPVSSAKSLDGDREPVRQSEIMHPDLSQVIRISSNTINARLPPTAQVVSTVEGEKSSGSFLRRNSGTGGGHYRKRTSRCSSDLNSAQSRITCNRGHEPSSSYVGPRSKIKTMSCGLQTHENRHCLPLFSAEAEGMNTYATERAIALASFEYLSTSARAIAGKMKQAYAQAKAQRSS